MKMKMIASFAACFVSMSSANAAESFVLANCSELALDHNYVSVRLVHSDKGVSGTVSDGFETAKLQCITESETRLTCKGWWDSYLADGGQPTGDNGRVQTFLDASTQSEFYTVSVDRFPGSEPQTMIFKCPREM